MYYFILWLFLLYLPFNALSLAITASFFNQHYSANNPLVLTENTTIQMDENILIHTQEPLFAIENQEQPMQLVFIQNNTQESFQVIITKGSVFNAHYFINNTHTITFKKTDLILHNNSTILLNGGNLAFFEGGTIIFED